jgi:hypothetical protein
MGMKYIVKSVSIFDSSVMMWEFDNEDEAKAKVRELKDTGSNYFMVKIYQTIVEQV